MEAAGMGTWEGGVGGPGAPDAVVLSPGQELPPCLETVLVVTTERGVVCPRALLAPTGRTPEMPPITL